ncbi:MAG: hypothetical protein QOH25_3869 [Acidobacteriota bacterium]|jgi:WD40 repeat protein|nr:hypothetical protein [Acidobacteriota bacterium]
MPYSEEDAPFFFGRETDRSTITANLLGSGLTLLYGAVGVGKSSLLGAGVAYNLSLFSRESMKLNGTPEFIVVVFSSWREDPVAGLSKSIEHSVRSILGEQVPKGIQPPDSLAQTIRLWSEIASCRLLIILDQFEEYFLYRGQERGHGIFYSELSQAVNDPNLRVSFLISLREDALSKLDLFKERIPNLFDNYLRVDHLSRAGAREAIKKPLEVYNQLMGEDGQFSIQEELVEEICDQSRIGAVEFIHMGRGGIGEVDNHAANNERIETSYLQLVMIRLWEFERQRGSHVLRLETLRKLGGAGNIVGTHLDTVMERLPKDDQDVAADAFRFLVTPSGTKIAYTASDLSAYTLISKEKIKSALSYLSDPSVRILRVFTSESFPNSEPQYEIFHDAMIPSIMEWRAYYLRDKEKARLEEEARQRIREESERIKRQQLRARRKQRQLYGLMMVSALITVMISLLYFYGEKQRHMAVEAAREADAQKVETQKALDTINDLDRALPYFKSVMRGHTASVLSVDFSYDQKYIVTASMDRTARVWDVETGKLLSEMQGHSAGLRSAVFSPDGKLVATASDDRTARLWDAATGQSLHTLQGHTGEVTSVRFSPDGNQVVTTSNDRTARVWDSATGQSFSVLEGHTGPVTYASFSLDGLTVVTTSTDGTARVWDVLTRSHIPFVGHLNVVNMASFSPNGDYVVTVGSDWDVRIWNVKDGRSTILKGHLGVVNSAEFSPNGAKIVTASDDKTARVWDVRTHEFIELKGHTEEVRSARFSADSTRILTASADNTARVWDANSGKVLFELRGHTNAVTDAVFSRVGDLVATASQDNTARTWDIAGEGGIQVTKVTIDAEPATYTGPCPVRVKVTALITAVGSGTIKYHFGRRGMRTEPERMLEFKTSGTKEVSITLRLGGRTNPNSSGSYYLEITSPRLLTSAEDATYSIRCQFLPSN